MPASAGRRQAGNVAGITEILTHLSLYGTEKLNGTCVGNDAVETVVEME